MARKNRQKRSESEGEVFLNLAYTRANEELFIGMIVAVIGLGLRPTCALSDNAPLQFNRALDTIGRCRLSLHDLSVLGADGKPPRTAHFNIPFELGLAVAASQQSQHDWFILGKDKNLVERALSDIKTVTVHEHDGSGESVVAAVSRALYREVKEGIGRQQLVTAYKEVRETWRGIRRAEQYTTPFLAPAFSALMLSAYRAANFQRKRAGGD